jgi:predicted ATPase
MANQPVNGQLYGPGITRIAVTGFKSLAEKTDVEIRPLTVLAGANSSGKSSLMQPLLLMKQTLESSVIPAGPFFLKGPYTRYTDTKQFLSRIGTGGKSLDRLEVDFKIGTRMTAGMTFAVEPNGLFNVIETRGSQLGAEMPKPWSIEYDSSSAHISSLDLPWKLVSNFTGYAEAVVEYHAERYKYYLRIQASAPTVAGYLKSQPYDLLETLALNFEIRRLVHIPGLRGDQLRKWLLAEVPSTNVYEGPFESYVPSIIEYWQQTNPLIGPSISELNAALKLLGLASSVRTLRLNESEVEMCVPRTFDSGDGDYVNVADVGLAVSTVLPVLVALIQADPGQLVYIEQPELHLHPKAQVLMAELLADAANRGVRLVIETHSSLLLQGILTCVAKGAITPDKVALHWFTRNEDGVTKVTTADLDAQGRFGDWPADFDSVEMKASNDYLDAMETTSIAS